MKNLFLFLFATLLFININAQTTAQVTFQVDMNDVVDPFTTPEVNGNFNSWCGNCWAMSDSNGDNIWDVMGIVDINTDYEFKFSADSWGIQESLLPGSPCTVTNFGFTNRTLNVSGDTTLPVFCWESCSDCGSGPSSYNVTFEVDMRNVTDPYTTPEVNGNFNGWCGSCWAMSDNNNDSIWEFTTIFAPGDSLEFKYSADNWSIQEELDSNLSCITINYDPSAPNGWGYVNRVAVVNSDTVFSSPWNACSIQTIGCTDSSASNYDSSADADDGSCLYSVVFNVDMNCDTTTFGFVHLESPYFGWCGGCVPMSDTDGDGIHTVTVDLPLGDFEYKYAVDSFAGQEDLIDDMLNGGSCAPITDYNSYANRQLTVSNWNLVWEENFSGTTLNDSVWTHEIGSGSQYGLWGWGNGEQQFYQPSNTEVNNGNLKITAQQEPNGLIDSWGNSYNLSSSRIMSKDKMEFRYGKIEARIKTINGEGFWPAFWMLPSGGSWPCDGEIDIMEQWGSDLPTTITTGAAHIGSCPGTSSYNSFNHNSTNGNYADDFHMYAVIWQEDYIAWYVDGVKVHSISPSSFSSIPGQHSWPFNSNQWYLIINLAIDQNGPNGNTQFPSSIEVDYIKIYENNVNNPQSLNYNFQTGLIANDVYGSCDSCVTSGSTLSQIDLPISWDDTTVNYTTTPFGGINSNLSTDPLDSTNNVLMTDRTAGSPTWAGTTLSTPNGLANAIPFASGSTKISANIYSPFFGVVVRLKAEDHTDPTKSVETEATITTANGWSTLVFDFSNEAPGTATIDFSYNYDMLSIFFDFGNVPSSSTIYYLDSIAFGDMIFGVSGCTDTLAYNYNPSATFDNGSCIFLGCMDSLALNYDSLATVDDGSCFYICATPPSESFENGFGYWQSYFSWVRTMGSTFTPNTGPSSAFDGDWYAYVESSFLNPGVSVWMDAGCVDLTTWNNPYFSFAYHMYGATIGSLEVKISTDGGNSWTTEWSKSGDQGNNWKEADIDLSSYSMYSYIKVRVFATVLAGEQGDIALDLLRFADLLPGCIDTNALNYDSIAGIDDGSCIYPELTVLSNISSPSCYGDIDGSIDLTVSGGTPPYSYLWNNGETTEDIFLLSSDTFSVIITDALGGSVLDTFFVTPTDSIITSVTIVNASDSLTSDGAIYTSITGGTPPFTYFWNDGSNFFSDTTDYLLNISYGTYNQYVIDFNNCFLLNTFNVSVDIDTCLYGCMDFNSVNYDSLATCDDGSCSPFIYGCTDPSALNYYPGANTDDGSCFYPNCSNPIPSGLSVNWTTDTKASVSWDNMNDMSCMVFKYFVRYRVVNSDGTYGNWVTKSAGVGNGLCNFGLNTTEKRLQLLTAATTYQFKMKAFYCGGTESGYSSPATFTTGADCPPMTNLSVTTFNGNQAKATFSWDTTGAYVFARIALRVDTTGAAWGTAGGFGIYYPTLTANKFGLTPGQSYRAQGRTFCDSNVTSYRSTWTTPVLWTQPGTLIRMESTSQIKNLDVYPNPSKDIFNIRFVSETIQDLSIRVINIMGELVYQENASKFIGEYTKKIDLGDYSKGVYFLEITTDKDLVNRKIVIQ